MLSAAVILFREVLEMALVVGLLLAVTKEFSGAWMRIAWGVVAGILGAMLVAWLMEELENAVSGNGEFIYNAILLSAASGMLAWSVVWMTRHGRAMTARLRQVGQSVSDGEVPGMALTVVAFATVIREGGEAVFFLAGIVQESDGQTDTWAMLTGGLIGIMLAIMIGLIVYRGILRIPVRHVLHVSGCILMLLAAGMASQAAWNLVVIDALPALIDPLWNASAWLPQSSWAGELLHIMMGYDDQPSGMQVLVFASSLSIMMWLLHAAKRPDVQPASTS